MNISGLVILSTLALAITPASASAATFIQDHYIGADNHGYGDVIGRNADFQINSMTSELNGTILTVSIDTTFAGKAGTLYRRSTRNGRGIGYGDLFLSSNWTPFGNEAEQYIGDDASNGTVWSYGLSLKNRFARGEVSKKASLYSLDAGDNATDIMMSSQFIRRGDYRDGQEVAVNRHSDSSSRLDNDAAWWVEASSINFSLDLAGTSLLNGSEIALHWGFTCQNDVIEGAMPISAVPVPAAAWLFGSGLIGLVILARRKQS